MKDFFKNFFNNIFTDYETMYTPHADAESFMYAYISTTTKNAIDGTHDKDSEEKKSNIIKFTAKSGISNVS